MHRGPAHAPGALRLAVRPGHGEVQADDLLDPAAQPALVALHGREPADVDRAEVQVGLPRDDPLRQGLARPAGERDARGVETGQHEVVIELGARPMMKLWSGVKLSGPL